VFGDSAKDANARLEKLRRQVFQALQSLKETGALGERP
jgi:hypothetical protein